MNSAPELSKDLHIAWALIGIGLVLTWIGVISTPVVIVIGVVFFSLGMCTRRSIRHDMRNNDH